MDKTFHSFNAFKKYYFPKEYRKEMEKRAMILVGFGRHLAHQFLNDLRKKLKEKKDNGS